MKKIIVEEKKSPLEKKIVVVKDKEKENEKSIYDFFV